MSCTGADLLACHQRNPARELAVADRQGAAVHAKSASQIGLWISAESQSPWGKRESSFELRFNSFSLLTSVCRSISNSGGEVVKYLFKKIK